MTTVVAYCAAVRRASYLQPFYGRDNACCWQDLTLTEQRCVALVPRGRFASDRSTVMQFDGCTEINDGCVPDAA